MREYSSPEVEQEFLEWPAPEGKKGHQKRSKVACREP